MVTVFGGTGYIGSRFCEMFDAEPQPRHSLIPQGSQILYMISTTHNHHLATNPYIDIDTNLTHLMRVLENVRHTPGAEFNFVSSWFVYGAVSELADERHACDPQGFYSITKRTAEQLLMAYCEHHRIPWRIFRLCNVVGGIDAGAGANKNALHAIARRLRNHEPITLANNGDFWRDYLSRDDVCSAMDWLLRCSAPNRIYNIGSGSPVRFRQAIDHIRSKIASRSEIHNQIKHDVIDCLLNTNRLQNLGWRPSLTLEQTLDRVIQDA